MSVVAALELEDLVTAGGAARQADGAHRGLRAGRHQADLLDAGERVDDARGQPHLELGGCAERGPAAGRLDRGLDDLGPGVTEQQGTPGLHEVDVPGPVGVPHEGALGPLVEARRPAHRAERADRRVDAAGDELGGRGRTAPRSGPLPPVLGSRPGCYGRRGRVDAGGRRREPCPMQEPHRGPEAPSPEGSSPRRLITPGRVIALIVAAIGLYVVWPSLVAVLASAGDLDESGGRGSS